MGAGAPQARGRAGYCGRGEWVGVGGSLRAGASGGGKHLVGRFVEHGDRLLFERDAFRRAVRPLVIWWTKLYRARSVRNGFVTGLCRVPRRALALSIATPGGGQPMRHFIRGMRIWKRAYHSAAGHEQPPSSSPASSARVARGAVDYTGQKPSRTSAWTLPLLASPGTATIAFTGCLFGVLAGVAFSLSPKLSVVLQSASASNFIRVRVGQS